MDQVDWIKEMIQREAKPEALRLDSIESFCRMYGIEVKDYIAERKKPETKILIIEAMLDIVSEGASDVMQALKEKATFGDVKAIELYMDYVLKLNKKLDPNVSVLVTQTEVEALLARLKK